MTNTYRIADLLEHVSLAARFEGATYPEVVAAAQQLADENGRQYAVTDGYGAPIYYVHPAA